MRSMNDYWLVSVRCREFQELESDPKETSRFILFTPGSECPSVRLVFDLISDLRLDDLRRVAVTTTDYRISRLVGQVDRFVARGPDLDREDAKAWLIKSPSKII